MSSGSGKKSIWFCLAAAKEFKICSELTSSTPASSKTTFNVFSKPLKAKSTCLRVSLSNTGTSGSKPD